MAIGTMDSNLGNGREKAPPSSTLEELKLKMSNGNCAVMDIERSNLSLEEKYTLVLKLAKQLESIATEDPLTGLVNERVIKKRLPEMLSELGKDNGDGVVLRETVLFVIDVDNFKIFNDTYKYEVGNRALKAVAEKLQRISRKDRDLVGRLHGEKGDEFIFAASFIDDKTAESAFGHLKSEMAEGIFIEDGKGAHIPVFVSIGHATAYDATSDTVEALMVKAEIEMKEDKNTKKVGR